MRTALVVYLLLSPLLLFAQQYNFRNWTVEDGLPQSQANAIIQDHKRHLWVATRSGIGRFDGKEFHTYTKHDGLGSNDIRSLFQDSQMRVWLGSNSDGAILYNGTSFTTYNGEAGLPSVGVRDFAEDPEGRVWLATDSGVYYFEKGVFTLYPHLPKQPYTSLSFAPADSFWVASATNGLYCSGSGRITHYTSKNTNLPSNSINTLLLDKAGTLWIGTNKGVALHKQREIQPLQLPEAVKSFSVSDFAQDSYHNIWIGLHHNGIIKYDGAEFTHITKENGLRTNHILSVTSDVEGNIWIGTAGRGVQQYKAPWFTHYFKLNGITEPTITALAKDTKGRLWVGTENGQVAYMEGNELHWLRTNLWPENTILHDMWVKNETDVWICTSNGVWNLGPNLNKHYTQKDGLLSNQVFQGVPDSTGRLWFATAKGVSIMEGNNFKAVPTKDTPTGSANYIYKDSRNQMWVGAEAGIYKHEGGRLVPVPTLNKFDFKEITSITEDLQGTLYFGSFNYGIIAHNPNWQEPIKITTAEGLGNEGIKSLLADSSNSLWIGTSTNIEKLNLEQFYQHGKFSFRSYGRHDGFQGIETSNSSIIELPDGSVWFGTVKGLTKYRPEMDRRNKLHVVSELTNIKLFLEPTDWQALGYKVDPQTGLPLNLKLPHHQNHITFDFHGICLSGPDQVEYRHRLLGHDERWSKPTEQDFATFASLSPGTYTFQLLTKNNDGYWTPEPIEYTFTITPPIWHREWFLGVLVLIVAGTAFSVVRLRERSLVKLNNLLEMKVHHRTKLLEEKNQEKEILLKEIHHRVKNNLQIVISMLNLQARQLKDTSSLDVMRALRNRVRSMALLHERLYQHEDLAEINLHDYFKGICESLFDSYGITSRQVHLELKVPPVITDIDTAITLGLIVNELVSNSLKYAFQGRTGKLVIELQEQANNFYTLTVSDNGKGFPPDFDEGQTKSFGLQLVTSLTKKLNKGHIEFIKNNGTNSILSFTLPS